MRFTVCLLALTLTAGEFGAEAAPLGNAKCGLASLKTAASMQAANDAIGTIATLAVNTNDAAMADAVSGAQAGLQDAAGAFQGIAGAILNKIAAQGLGAKGLQGLTAAKTAVDNIKAAKGGAAAGLLAKAKAKIAEALANGKQVAQCGDAAAADAGAANANATAAANATAVATDTAAVNATATATDAAAANATAAANNTGTAATANNANNAAQPTPATTKQTKIQAATSKNQGVAKTQKRQFLKALGGIGCNIARLQTVTDLATSSQAVSKLSTAAAADAATAGAATTATDGLNSAKAGIATIAKDILTGQTPSAAARTQVQTGLNAAKTALAGITSTDPAVTAAVAAAAAKVDKTIAAGGQVVAKC